MGSYCYNWFEKASEIGYGEDLYFNLKELLEGKSIDLIEYAMSYIVTLYLCFFVSWKKFYQGINSY